MFYERLEKIINKDNLDNLKNTKVLIVGLGGVGGIAFEMLLRSAIGSIYVCDYDKFEESNLNRQTLCFNSVIGKFKTDVAQKIAKDINKDCKIIKICNKLTKDNINQLLPSDVDYIIDACDDVNAKISLVKFAIKNNIKIISSMGCGNKLNPEKLKITNIWNTQYDPLAKKVRNLLRKEKIFYKLPVVSSDEIPIIKVEKQIGSFAPVTNTSGILLANYVLNDVIKIK